MEATNLHVTTYVLVQRNNLFVVKAFTFCLVPVMLQRCERGQGFRKD